MTFPTGRQWIASDTFARPTESALRAIAEASPHGVIEIGAGTGYWARLLHDRGVEVVAFDVAPPPSADNPWFAGVTPWYPVHVGDESAVDLHAQRTLLLVWPTRNEDWGADAVARFAAAGGKRLAYVGETVGGRTGDDRLHALLGELDRCWSCAYGLQTSPCVCGIQALWRCIATVRLPDSDDELRLYRRDDSALPLASTPVRTRRAPWPQRLARALRRRKGDRRCDLGPRRERLMTAGLAITVTALEPGQAGVPAGAGGGCVAGANPEGDSSAAAHVARWPASKDDGGFIIE